MKIKAFINRLFGPRLRFHGTPEQFLAMILFFSSRNQRNFSPDELLEWAVVIQKMLKFNLKPYKDFNDLVINGLPDFSRVSKAEMMLQERLIRESLEKSEYTEPAPRGYDHGMPLDSEPASFAFVLNKEGNGYDYLNEEEVKRRGFC